MSKKTSHLSAFKVLQKHRPTDRKLWETLLEQLANSKLPVRFYESNSSQAVLINEDLDERARSAFSPVIKMIEQIQSGTLQVRTLTRADADEIQSTLEDIDRPESPEWSIEYVEELSDQLVALLKTLANPEKAA